MYLSGSNIGDSELADLAEFPNLELLQLENTAITDEGLALLAHWQKTYDSADFAFKVDGNRLGAPQRIA